MQPAQPPDAGWAGGVVGSVGVVVAGGASSVVGVGSIGVAVVEGVAVGTVVDVAMTGPDEPGGGTSGGGAANSLGFSIRREITHLALPLQSFGPRQLPTARSTGRAPRPAPSHSLPVTHSPRGTHFISPHFLPSSRHLRPALQWVFVAEREP